MAFTISLSLPTCICIWILFAGAAALDADISLYCSDSKLPQPLPSGNYGGFNSLSSFSGHILMLSLGDGCTLLSPAATPSNSSHLVVVTHRGNCTFLQKALVAMSHGADGLIVIDYVGAPYLVVMGGATYVSIPAVSVSADVGSAIAAAGPDCNISVSSGSGPIYPTTPGDTIPLYTKTAVFVVLAVMIGFVACIYCQGSFRHFMAVNAARAQQARAIELARIDGERAKERILELPIVTYSKSHRTEADNKTSNDTCAVCMEDFNDNDSLRKLPCTHLFHCTCIDPWLLSNRTCPLCKANILDTPASRTPSPVAHSPDRSSPNLTSVVVEVSPPSSLAPSPASASRSPYAPADRAASASPDRRSFDSLRSASPTLPSGRGTSVIRVHVIEAENAMVHEERV